MKPRLLLINPPYPFEESPSPPFGLMSLAAFMAENGFDVLIEDYIVNPCTRERLERTIADFRPDFAGATAVTMNVNRALSLLRDVKEIAPGVTTLMGGPHATFDAESILKKHPEVDYIVRGEGELTLLELLRTLINRGDAASVPGVSFRGPGGTRHNEQRPLIADINILPYPARDLVSLSKYRAIGLPINMLTSRGCPFECVFCVGSKMVGRKVRYFDVKRVVDEFEMLSKLGFRQINIVDDLFTSNKKRCIEVCEEIVRRGITHEWTAFARVDTVSPELLAAMKKAGCTTLCFGIESGNQGILDRVKKKTSLDMCRNAIRLCNEAGIVPMTSYILGLPGETPETVRETMELARELSPSYGYHILAPFPGTEVREKAAEYGIRVLTDDWDLYDANRSVAESVTMPAAEVDRIVNEFNGGIHRMVEKAADRYDRGESLGPEELQIVRGLKNAVFSMEIILKELVENYPGVAEERRGEMRDDFAEFLSGRIAFTKERAADQIDRLVSLNCLAPECGNGVCRYGWA